MSALTSLLVRDGILPARKIEEALQRQVIAGGDVETVLLEMDAVAENVLAAYRASLHGTTPATRAEVMTVPPELVRLVPAEVALEHRLVPLALRGRVLDVAVRSPLASEQKETLEFLLGYELQARLACEVRIAAGLAHHYGGTLPPRFTRLLDRLRKRDAGPVPWIGRRTSPQLGRRPSDVPYRRAEAGAHDASAGRPRGSLLVEPAPADEAPARFVRPRRTTSRGLGAVGRAEPVAGIPDDEEPEQAQSSISDAGATSSSAAEPAIGGAASLPSAEPPPRRAELPPAPPAAALTFAAGEGLLERASTRDEILDVLLAFAQQSLDYVALFVVQDDVADGREAVGAGASREDVRAITIPLERTSVFAEVRRLRAPLVLTLGASELERETLLALGRAPTTTALLLPIAIRQRVVLLIYGDRDGETFDLGAVMELVRFGARVADALERLILRHKRVAPRAGEASARLEPMARTLAKMAGSEREKRAREGSERPRARTPAPDPLDSWSSVLSDASAPAALRPSPPARRVSETNETLAMRAVTVESAPSVEALAPTLPPDAPPERVLGIPRSAPPPPPVELDPSGPELAVDALVARAKAEEERASAARDDEEDDDDPVLEIVEPDEDEDDFEIEIGEADEADFEGLDEDELDELDRASERPGSYKLRGGPVEVVRLGAGGGGDPHEDATARLRASLVPPPRGPHVETRSVIVDMGEQVHAQVEDLLAAQGEARQKELIRGLLYMGEAALPALVQAFPGPLEVDRSTRPVPAGRDVSIVARALVAFGARAVPYVAGLLSSGQADVRYYAALVASDLVHPELMEAVAARIHDEDEGVRRLACALLPRFAGHRRFDAVRKSIRRAARLRGRDPARRWQALDALVALRDREELERILDLLDEDDAKLVDHAHRALVILTCADHGRSHRRWRAWFDRHGAQHRIEWLIEGLLHGEESIRALASAELERLTQERFGYDASAPKRERERAYRSYRRWWDEEGAQRFG